MYKNLFTLFLLQTPFFLINGLTQEPFKVKETIHLSWDSPKTFNTNGTDEKIVYLSFSNNNLSFNNDFLPVFEKGLKTRKKNLNGLITPSWSNEVFELCSEEEEKALARGESEIGGALNVEATLGVHRGDNYISYSFIPIIKKNGAFYKLISATLELQVDAEKKIGLKARTFADQSILATGSWYKIGIAKTGIYKMDKSFLSSIGVDVETLNPKNIRVYGNGGGQLPFENNIYRHDDLMENAIYVSGEDDGVFNEEDYVLFYATEQTKWTWNAIRNAFEHTLNDFDDTSYYFINVDLGNGLRVAGMSSLGSHDKEVSSFIQPILHEDDRNSLINSGRVWYGETFDTQLEYTFDFALQNRVSGSNVKILSALAAHSVGASSSFDVYINGQKENTAIISPVSGSYEARYAWDKIVDLNTNIASNNLAVKLNYNKSNSSSLGWLNYLEINYERALNANVNQLRFSNSNTSDFGKAIKYTVSNADNVVHIWDVSNPIVPMEVDFEGSSTVHFTTLLDTQKTYIAFTNEGFLTPKYIGAVENQNVHAIQQADYVIVTHPNFVNAANDLAEFHAEKEGLSYAIVTTDQLFNEYSSGAQDITAIKDFMKMLYDRAEGDINKMPRYLLLIGDGSYDNKHRLTVNSNYIPTYQSQSSLIPADNGTGGSYISDDYFGLLDDGESDNINDLIDIGIGRFPVRTLDQAMAIVGKIKHYYSTQTHGSWRNVIALIGDDEDSNMHMSQADDLSEIIEEEAPVFNLDKIFFDAYQQDNSAGGARYPDVNAAIKKRISSGSIFMTYTGHGGELGWGHERVLTIPEINDWINKDNMPAMLTATCEFSRFDNPYLTSAGELTLLNPDGGAIGLLTTTRLVYAGPNFVISQRFFENAFKLNDYGEIPSLGDLNKITKILGPKVVNTRNFSLLGDPALRLAYPSLKVYTTSMPDTIKSLGKVTIKGYVGDENGVKIDDYNGIVYPTVFDKSKQITTVNNDNVGEFNFKIQNSVLFKGKASVKNGDFEFSFVVPKDIELNFDSGKVSYYISDQITDGNGFYRTFQVGGIDENAEPDDEGPDIELYLNDESFVFGGVTNESPKIYALLEDENGINTTGNGIGHDIVAVLDENTNNKIILNDYYESELDSYQKGKVIYPLEEIEPGKHTISFKAWDVHNNSGEAYTEFIVAESAELAIEHLLNYPNPFTTNTAFYFDHNQPGSALDVIINIYTVSGKLVKTLNTQSSSNGFRAGPFEWQGKDEFGDQLAKGVYVYKLKVVSPKGEEVEKMEKLVILK